jgi:hypothetical protein
MADTQVKNETTLATSDGDEVIYIVDDPTGTPLDRKVTAKALRVVLNQGTVALTDAATIATDCSLGNFFTVTMGGSRTFGAPTNMKAGASYIWVIRQDGTGNRVATWNAAWKFPGGTDAVLTTTASAVDVVTGIYDGTDLMVQSVLNFA